MKTKILVLLMLYVVLSSCEQNNETAISNNGSDESHKAGENCMNCHKSGGEGEGWFTMAGSVYKQDKTQLAPGGYITLTSGPANTGSTIYTLEVDKFGNFYTTEKIDFGTGLYVSVTSANGTTKNMISPVSTGACNTCHNSSNRIWVEM